MSISLSSSVTHSFLTCEIISLLSGCDSKKCINEFNNCPFKSRRQHSLIGK